MSPAVCCCCVPVGPAAAHREREMRPAVTVFSARQERSPRQEMDRAAVTVIDIVFDWKAVADFVGP